MISDVITNPKWAIFQELPEHLFWSCNIGKSNFDKHSESVLESIYSIGTAKDRFLAYCSIFQRRSLYAAKKMCFSNKVVM